MEWRCVVEMGGKFARGSIHELPRSTAEIICRQNDLELVDAMIPNALGQHHRERPLVVVRELPQALRLPPIPARSRPELDAALAELEAKQEANTTAIEEARDLHGQLSGQLAVVEQRYSLSGCGKNEFDQVAQLREQADQALTAYEAAQLAYLACGQQVERTRALLREWQAPEILAAVQALRDAAVVLAQIDPALLGDPHRANPQYRSAVGWTHGPATALLHNTYCDSIAKLTGQLPQHAVVSPAGRQLVSWAQEAVNVAVVG